MTISRVHKSLLYLLCLLVVGASAQIPAAPILTLSPATKSPGEEQAAANNVPAWTITDQSIESGAACTLDLTTVSSDADGDTLTYTLVSGSLPTGCSLSGSSITGTATTEGEYTFALGADDGRQTTLRPEFTSSATLSWSANAFTPAQTEQFSVSFPITPIDSNIDHVCGFSEVSATGYSHLLAAVRLNTAGNFDARDNAAYAADAAVGYAGGGTYQVEMHIDVSGGTYDVEIDGTLIADDFVFRGAALPASLGYITCVDAASPGVVGTVSGAVRLVQPITASATWTVFVDDATPPDPPAAPTITGVTQTTVTMSLPVSGAADHSFYRIQRSPSGCASYAQIQDNYTQSTFTDTGRSADTEYCYRLVDVDVAGNASAEGTGATATTASVDVNSLLSIADVAANEGNTGTSPLTFVLTASASQAFDIVCSYQTQGGTADSSTDYTSASGTVTISAGMTTEDIVVTINGDVTAEANETLQMRVYNCGQDGISVNPTEFLATGTITNDDAGSGSDDLSIGNASLSEGDSGTAVAITFTVTLDSPQGSDVIFDYYTLDGSATAWSDYVPVSGKGIIRAGQTTFAITVPLIGDTVAEGGETFTVRIANQGVVP